MSMVFPALVRAQQAAPPPPSPRQEGTAEFAFPAVAEGGEHHPVHQRPGAGVQEHRQHDIRGARREVL